MNLFERIEHVRDIVVASTLDEEPRGTSLHMNERCFEKPRKYDRSQGAMMAQAQAATAAQGAGLGYQAPPPPPKGKWIAQVGRFWTDADDPSDAVAQLEATVAREVSGFLDRLITDRQKRLSDAQRVAEAVRALDTSGTDREVGE